MSNKPTHRDQYCPYPFEVPETRLAVDLREGETIVKSVLRVVRRPGTTDPLVLDGVGLDLRGIAVDGVPLKGNEYSVDADSLSSLPVPGAPCRFGSTRNPTTSANAISPWPSSNGRCAGTRTVSAESTTSTSS